MLPPYVVFGRCRPCSLAPRSSLSPVPYCSPAAFDLTHQPSTWPWGLFFSSLLYCFSLGTYGGSLLRRTEPHSRSLLEWACAALCAQHCTAPHDLPRPNRARVAWCCCSCCVWWWCSLAFDQLTEDAHLGPRRLWSVRAPACKGS